MITSGGHGTVARALVEGVPLLVCPAGADQPENGVRAAWAGAGLVLPRRLLGARPLRWSVRRLLADSRFAARAGEFAAWSLENDGARRGADLVERYARPDTAAITGGELPLLAAPGPRRARRARADPLQRRCGRGRRRPRSPRARELARRTSSTIPRNSWSSASNTSSRSSTSGADALDRGQVSRARMPCE